MGSGLIILQKAGRYAATGLFVERNALRANLVASAKQGRWTSLWHRVNKSPAVTLADWPLRPGQKWLDYVSQPETEAELKALRRSAHGGTPFGKPTWQQATAKRLGLESSFRPPGRPQSAQCPSVTGPKATQIDTNETRPHFRPISVNRNRGPSAPTPGSSDPCD